VQSIISLLLKEFLILVLAAIIFAWPFGYFFMNRWLQDFAYKADFSISLFLTAGILALFTAALTVGFHTFRASTANPVDSIRYE
jgi:putative ABC transport system permease protein